MLRNARPPKHRPRPATRPLPPMRRLLRFAAAASIAGVPTAIAIAAPGEAARGRALMAQYQCGRCHTIPGVPAARGVLAVPLDAFGKRSYIGGRLPNRRDLLVRWIVDPPALIPGTRMPALGVSADDAAAMAAYLEALR